MTVVSDVYFNVLMNIIEEVTFQINCFTFIFLGKDVIYWQIRVLVWDLNTQGKKQCFQGLQKAGWHSNAGQLPEGGS